jgi:hypothetical protein
MDTVTIPENAVLMRSESTPNHEYYITADALVYRRSRNTGETERVLPREWSAYLFVRCGSKHHRLHRLVARYFVPNPDPAVDQYVDHINGNKLDNRAANLRWCSNLENQMYFWHGSDTCRAVTACDEKGNVLKEFESYHRAEIWLIETGRDMNGDTHSYISRVARRNRELGMPKYSYKGVYWM